MYLKQMGQVPLLTREQEVEISKTHRDRRKPRQTNHPQFRVHRGRVRRVGRQTPSRSAEGTLLIASFSTRKIEGRETHLKVLRKLCVQVGKT